MGNNDSGADGTQPMGGQVATAGAVGPAGPTGPAGAAGAAGASGSQNVANMTALAALASASFGAGTSCEVDTIKAVFDLLPSTAAVQTMISVAASGKAGFQWVRRTDIGCVVWQLQLLWSVDESNSTGLASDENSGVDDTHPLLTHAECARRTWGAQAAPGTQFVIRSLSNLITSGARYNICGLGSRSATPVGPFVLNCALNIVGIPTVIYSGTIATPVQALKGTVGDIHFTDVLQPAFSKAIGRLWKTTAPSVSYFWPLKDLGASVSRISVPARNANNNARTLANGDTWSIVQLPTAVGLINIGSTDAATATQLAFLDIRDQTTLRQPVGSVIYWGCDFTGSSDSYSGAIEFRNCKNWRLLDDACAQPTTTVVGGAVDLVATGGFAPINGKTEWAGSSTQYTCFQGVPLTTDRYSAVVQGQFSFYDLATACVVVVPPFGIVDIVNIGGTGNTGKIIDVTGSGCQVVVGTAAVGMTSDIVPFKLNGISSATPNLVDFAVKANCIVAA